MNQMQNFRQRGQGGAQAQAQQAAQHAQQNAQQNQPPGKQFAPGQGQGNGIYQPNTMFAPNTVPSTLNNFLLNGYLTAPGQVASDINSAMSEWQYYADRGGQRNMIRDIAQILAGGNNRQQNQGPRLAGFQDTKSPNGANVATGQVTSGVTMQPLSTGQVGAGIDTIASAQGPKVGGQYGASGAGELNGHLASLTQNAAGRNALNAERDVSVENASLGRAAEVARADDEIAKLRWIMGRHWGDNQFAVNQQNQQRQAMTPLIQMLGGMA